MKIPRLSGNAVLNLVMLALTAYQTYLTRYPPDATAAVTISSPVVNPAPFDWWATWRSYWPVIAMAGLVMFNLLVQVWARRTQPKKDGRLFGRAVDKWEKEREEADRVAALPAVVAAKAETEDARNERDSAVRQLKAATKDYNEERLRAFAHRAKKNLEMAKLKGTHPPEELKDVHVTVRFAVYADLPLAQTIERILKEHTQWPVELDMSNKPILLPNEKGFKVMFDIGPMDSFMPVAHAFDDGQLIDASVGVRRTERWGDSERLVVEVLPTTP